MVQALIVGLTCVVASWLAGATVQPADTPAGGSVSTGFAADLRPSHGTERCANPKVNVQPDVFPTTTGTVKSSDGRTWLVPGPVHDGGFAVDLYNDCAGAGDNPDHGKQLQTVVIDPDGVEITGYIFADNYYERELSRGIQGRRVHLDPQHPPGQPRAGPLHRQRTEDGGALGGRLGVDRRGRAPLPNFRAARSAARVRR